jgi:hypothetical protein
MNEEIARKKLSPYDYELARDGANRLLSRKFACGHMATG